MQWIDRIGRVVLRSALLWGALASVGFYFAVQFAAPYLNPYLLRCLNGLAIVVMLMIFATFNDILHLTRT